MSLCIYIIICLSNYLIIYFIAGLESDSELNSLCSDLSCDEDFSISDLDNYQSADTELDSPLPRDEYPLLTIPSPPPIAQNTNLVDLFNDNNNLANNNNEEINTYKNYVQYIKVYEILNFINNKNEDMKISKCPVMLELFRSILISQSKCNIPNDLLGYTLCDLEMYVKSLKTKEPYQIEIGDATIKHKFNLSIKLFFKKLEFVYTNFYTETKDLLSLNDMLRYYGVKKCLKCYKVFVLSLFYRCSSVKAKYCRQMCPQCNFKYNGIDVVNYEPNDLADHQIRIKLSNNYNKIIKNKFDMTSQYNEKVQVNSESSTQTDIIMNSSYGTQVTGDDIDEEIKEMLKELSQKRKRGGGGHRKRRYIRSKHF